MLCILLLAYGCPLACFFQAWMHTDAGVLFFTGKQAAVYQANRAVASEPITAQTNKHTTACILCRNHDVVSSFIDVALLTLALLVFSPLTSTPLRISPLFLRVVPQAPPLRPPRLLAV
ncbi:MAG: hypothetical protein U0350_12090 [Caldilineaceae bacterium]